MSKKNALIIIIFLVLLIGGILAGLYFYFGEKEIGGDNNNSQNTSVFPGTPGGGNTAPEGTAPSASVPSTPVNPNAPVPKLRQITSVPVAGAVVFERPIPNQPPRTTPIQTETAIRFMERATGHIFETMANSLTVTRISNKTIPIVYESIWNSTGTGALVRRLKDGTGDIETFLAILKNATTTVTDVTGVFLPINITTAATAPTGTQIFYLYNTPDGAVGMVSDGSGSKKSTIFETPLQEWLAIWTEPKTITLTTKAADSIPGYAYFLNPDTGTFSRVLGNVNGLTTLTNPTGDTILYSSSSGGSLTLSLHSVKSGLNSDISLQTFPEKCAWSKKDKNIIYCGVPVVLPMGLNYPDAWYQGSISFTDEIWKINAETGETSLLAAPTKITQTNIDVINPMVSGKENVLIFTNKDDLTLWSLALE